MDASIQVNHFSTFPHGGAGNAALSIHRSLQKIGLKSRFYFRRGEWNGDHDATVSHLDFPDLSLSTSGLRDRLSLPRQWARRVEKRRVRRVLRFYQRHLQDNRLATEVFSQAEEVQQTPAPAVLRGGILHLHWTAFGFDWPSFFHSLPDSLPIVWTLHDQNLFTGGCHYTSGCDRFAQGCGNCPQLPQRGVDDLSRHNFRIKRSALAGRNLHVVSPSYWLLQQARRSPILSHARSFTHIPYGLDTEVFENRPWDHQVLSDRQKNLWNERQPNLIPTVLLGAQDLNNQRKGILWALKAIHDSARSTGKRIRLWTFGSGVPEELLAPLADHVIVQQWGFISNPALLGRLYQQADIFLLPSLEDNQPQTALEAMCQQTPVIAFAAGGIAEVVRDGVSGYCVPVRDMETMTNRLTRLIQNPATRLQMGLAAQQQIREEHDPRRQATAYARLYRHILTPQDRLPISA